MKFADLLKKDARELQGLCSELKREHMNLRILSVATQDVKASTLRACKRNIARVKTRLRQINASGGQNA
jgi:ribosomal protein L29